MPYILENMTQEDISQVAKIERLCFSLPWPTSAYRRELKTPDTNRYIIERFIPSQDIASLGLAPPTDANLTSLYHPELGLSNGTEPAEKSEKGDSGFLSRWATLLPWVRNGSDPAAPHDAPTSPKPHTG
jgi:hypothetical protein